MIRIQRSELGLTNFILLPLNSYFQPASAHTVPHPAGHCVPGNNAAPAHLSASASASDELLGHSKGLHYLRSM
eukprot:scaffold101942_cov28-Tisochrysis_lutea.AAC.4